MQLAFGVTAKDRISGFTGVVVGKASYITGCDQYLVQPKMTNKQVLEGEKPDGQWFDENRVEEVPGEVVSIDTDSETKGACDPAPVK
ncbi:MAG: hypothetical protein AB7E51_06690 [Pseudodesulfovibrio sp.]|uniref:hypothetical protein n=1 Tax=Pseudodesulfovibrio sp. TaxID=2035812 RepID=UPI003D096E35